MGAQVISGQNEAYVAVALLETVPHLAALELKDKFVPGALLVPVLAPGSCW